MTKVMIYYKTPEELMAADIISARDLPTAVAHMAQVMGSENILRAEDLQEEVDDQFLCKQTGVSEADCYEACCDL